MTKKELIAAMDRGDELLVTTREAVDESLSRNGGDYHEWEVWYRLPNRKWQAEFQSSADFPMCPVCGRYGDDCQHDDDDGMQLTADELFRQIRKEKLEVQVRWTAKQKSIGKFLALIEGGCCG